MAIILPSGFVITNNEPVDSRLSVADSASRFSLSVNNVYEGITVYERDTDTIYVLTNATAPSSASSWVALITNTSSSIATSASFATTASFALSGNGLFSGSFSGSFQGNGSGLTDIPASGIVGLNLSQIASGSATASISPDMGLQINTNTTITGSLTITPPGSGNIFVVRSLSTPAGSFTIDSNGRIGIGAAPNSTYRLNVSSNTSIIGIYGYASFAGIFGVSENQGVRGAGTIGVYGEADGKDYGVGVSGFAKDDSAVGSILNIGGKFSATGAIDNYAIQLQDGTENVDRILVSATADGKAHWSSAITASLQGTASYALTASYAPAYLPLAGGTINGNLTVLGTASFAYTTASIVQVGANTIILNTDYPSVRFGGISVIDSGSFGNSSTGSLFWDSMNNRWIYANPSGSAYDGGMLLSGPRNTSGIGNETGMTANFVAVGQSADHLQPGTIFNSGSVTQVTGSLLVTAGVTGSFTGSYVGSGDGLYNIPAAGIVGLNLSQISSGSVSASISPNFGLQINTNVTAISFTGSFSGSGAGLSDIFPVTTNAQILISTGSVLAARSVTGDIAITNAGVTTIQTGAVTFSKIQTLSQAALIGATGSAGGTVQEIPIIEAYVPTGSAFTALLENTANWDINGVYIGSTITGTYQGQSHLNNDYWFTAVADNNWIRLIRG